MTRREVGVVVVDAWTWEEGIDDDDDDDSSNSSTVVVL